MPLRLIALVFILMSCAPRAAFVAAPAGGGVEPATTIFVGTMRQPGPEGFTRLRSDTTGFVRYDLSIPTDREPGSLDWPRQGQKPDPKRHFLLMNETRFASAREFRAALSAAMGRQGQTDAVVYVHGFNNTMADSVLRVAQMHHDLRVPGVGVHFAWPSRGSALGYVYDRESAMFSRSGFEELLDSVADAGAREIVIVAHSMGSALTMETLRQMAIRKDSRTLGRIAGVILISPDLDVDVFRSQARDMGGLPQPFVIFGSSRDRVLGLSALIAGEADRLGRLDDVSRLADLKVIYLDTAAYNTGSGHLNLGQNPALLSLFGGLIGIDQAFKADARSRIGLLPGLVLTVQNATKVVLAPVEAIVDPAE
ncbi:alpha/beta hydrolase [Tabrizicola sp. YIM 78059]|uniref:alpha/beta hydrolase n=1 Tax=Tabrizicola sp. YIM 78059 TaxID=2529861 RepID=UPI0010AB3D0D|nr:alpha/beta fold hydrolase [Tabrizicola sp. YIM 78059]